MAEATLSKIAPMTENGNNCPTSEHAARRSGPIRASWLQSPSLASWSVQLCQGHHNPIVLIGAFYFINVKFRQIVPRANLPPELWGAFQGNPGMNNGEHCPPTQRRESANTDEETRPSKTASILTALTARTRRFAMTIDVKRWAMVLSAGTLLAAFSGVPSVSAMTRARFAQDQAAQGGPDERRLPLFGKITAMHDSTMDVLDTNGDTIHVKFNGQTQFRKDRQPAKRTDFKVGDIILVRGQEAADHSWTAETVAARSLNGQGGPGGRGGFGGGPGGSGRGGFQQQGTLGKDYVAGEIKSIDAPKITVLRSDNVTQTLELNEDTSMRKGRDSITMADIQAGDHVFARGAVENNVFVPKTVVVVGPDQWKRMQEFGQQARGEGGSGRRRQQGGQSQEGSSGAADATAPNAAPPTPPAPNPPSPAPTPAPAPTPQLGQQMEPHH
jgi:Domain of unknown function (DUF5666)